LKSTKNERKIMNTGKKNIIGINILILTLFCALMQFQDGSDLLNCPSGMSWMVLALFTVSASIGAYMVVPMADIVWVLKHVGKLPLRV
jgi:hypothetical protein